MEYFLLDKIDINNKKLQYTRHVIQNCPKISTTKHKSIIFQSLSNNK